MQSLPTIPADLPQPTGAAPAQPDNQSYYYCIEEFHPGVPMYSQQPLDTGRIFAADSDQGCPVCPGCQREVSAIPCIGPAIPPQSVVEYARRVGAQVRGGIAR